MRLGSKSATGSALVSAMGMGSVSASVLGSGLGLESVVESS
jgi:hypothetical protein